MRSIKVHEAKTNLSKLIEQACRGKEVIIAGAGAASLLTVVSIGSWLPDAQVFAGKWAMRATFSA